LRGCTAGFPIGGSSEHRACQFGVQPAGWETRETADLEVCGTKITNNFGRHPSGSAVVFLSPFFLAFLNKRF
jgi:hypothetical protein